MRRILALLLCLLLVWGLAACKEEKRSSKNKKPSQSQDKEDTEDTDTNDDTDHTDDSGDHTPDETEDTSSNFWENEEGLTVPPDETIVENAEEVADDFMTALQTGDWETVNQRIPGFALSGGSADGVMEGGIMEKIMHTMTVTEQTVTDNGDGSYTVCLTIETIDYKALLEALPENIYSKEAARKELLKLAESAERREFEGTFILRQYAPYIPYYVEPDASFINAITGGYYDLYMAVMGEVLAQ